MPTVLLPSEVRAVLFDFDGTLADSYGAIAASVNHVRAARGLGPLSVEEVKRHVGRGPQYLLQHTVPGTDLDHDLALYRAHHPSVMVHLTELLPGAADAVAALRANGRQLALCSNKPRLFSQELLRHLHLLEAFAVVIGPEDVPQPKPAPDMVLAALERLRVNPAAALYIGDMCVDIQTARAAGVRVWVVPTGSEEPAVLKAARPDRVLRDLYQLAECVRE